MEAVYFNERETSAIEHVVKAERYENVAKKMFVSRATVARTMEQVYEKLTPFVDMNERNPRAILVALFYQLRDMPNGNDCIGVVFTRPMGFYEVKFWEVECET